MTSDRIIRYLFNYNSVARWDGCAFVSKESCDTGTDEIIIKDKTEEKQMIIYFFRLNVL